MVQSTVQRLFDFRLWFIPPSILLTLCLILVVQVQLSEAKTRVEKVEKFREWAQDKLAQVAEELSQKGIEPSSFYKDLKGGRGNEAGGKLQVYRAEGDAEQEEEEEEEGNEGGEVQSVFGRGKKYKVEAELQYWAKKHTTLRRHNLDEKPNSLGIDAQPALSDIETGSSRSEPTMVELPMEEGQEGAEERSYRSLPALLHNDTAKDNAMLGEEDEPFHIPHHETEAINTPRARPPMREKNERVGEGRLAHAIRDMVEPVLPIDGGVNDKHRTR